MQSSENGDQTGIEPDEITSKLKSRIKFMFVDKGMNITSISRKIKIPKSNVEEVLKDYGVES